MKKFTIFIALALALSTIALANPVFADRGAEASNALYQGIGGGDCDDTDRCIRPGEVALTVQNWTDSDSDGDGISDLTLESTELISINQGQVISAVKAEKKKPKFKAGAELSKTARDNEPTTPKLLCLCSWDYLGIGDLDGDGLADVVIAADRNEETVTVAGTEISKRDARKGFYKTEHAMNKAELIEAMASNAELSKADSKKALEGFVRALRPVEK